MRHWICTKVIYCGGGLPVRMCDGTCGPLQVEHSPSQSMRHWVGEGYSHIKLLSQQNLLRYLYSVQAWCK